MTQLHFKKHGYEVTNQGTWAEVRIVGEINWWNNGSDDFTRMLAELRAAGVAELRGYINTPGGSMWEANEIFNQLTAFPGKKTVVLGALVASAGTTIACAFKDGIEMAANGQYMIHNPELVAVGGEKELKAALQLYANIRAAAVEIYVQQTGQTADEISAMMEATTWMTAAQAKEKGFITGILGEADTLPPDAPTVLNRYRNVPAAVNQAALAFSVSPTNSSSSSTMNKDTLITMLGLPPNSSDAAVELAVSQAHAGSQKVTQLTNELNTEKQRVATERAEQLVTNAIEKKKVSPAQRENLVKMAVADFDGAKALIDSLTPAPAMATDGVVPDGEPGKVSNQESNGTQQDRSKWGLDEYVKHAPEDLKMMAEKEPAKYRTLVNNRYPTIGKK